MALRGVYELTETSVYFDTDSSMLNDLGTNWKRQNMCIQNRGIKNNGCGMSEVTSNVHEMVGYQLDGIMRIRNVLAPDMRMQICEIRR